MNARIPASAFQPDQALSQLSQRWDEGILPQLTDYIAIPAKSPGFAPDWEQQGLLDRVLRNAAEWVEAQKVPGLVLEIVRMPGRTPVLFFEVDGTQPQAASGPTVLMYGHLDKQPEFDGWRADLGPWTPKYEDGKLYGRGGADDGYAVYASIAAVQELKRQNVPHPRIVGLIETCEESGSRDLLPYIEQLRPRLGDVALVICLDSGAGNYDQLWLTTSLRGMASGTLKVEILTEGVHSGDASGLVPSSFRIMRQVLDRLEDSATGRLLPASFHCTVPAERLAQARATAAILGDEIYRRFPWAHYDCGGSTTFALPTTTEPVEALLKRTWEPTLSVTGAEGFPALQDAPNCARPARRQRARCGRALARPGRGCRLPRRPALPRPHQRPAGSLHRPERSGRAGPRGRLARPHAAALGRPGPAGAPGRQRRLRRRRAAVHGAGAVLRRAVPRDLQRAGQRARLRPAGAVAASALPGVKRRRPRRRTAL